MSEALYRDAAEETVAWIEQALEDNGCGVLPLSAVELTDSPIEAQLLVALAFYYRLWGQPLVVMPRNTEIPEGFFDQPQDHAILIIPQRQIRDYRVDFAVYTRSSRSVKVVVECDGHAFHERTKEQASRDKSRDRELQSLGYKVIRFTGSEIYRKPLDMAREVVSIVEGAVHDWWMSQP